MTRSHGGLGLGLALAKGIGELHGGTVRAESGGIGRGAEFVVSLPTAVAPVQALERAGVQPIFSSRRVLVVDDNRDGAESLAQVVELLGQGRLELRAIGRLDLDRVQQPGITVDVLDAGV